MQKLAFTLPEFFDVTGISRSAYFRERAAGRGPREFRVGRKVLISVDDAKQYVARRAAGAFDETAGK